MVLMVESSHFERQESCQRDFTHLARFLEKGLLRVKIVRSGVFRLFETLKTVKAQERGDLRQIWSRRPSKWRFGAKMTILGQNHKI